MTFWLRNSNAIFEGKIAQLCELVKSTIFIVGMSNFGILYFKRYIFKLCRKNFRFIGTLNNNSTGDKDKYVIFRDKSAHNLSAFKDDQGKIHWAEIPGLDDPSCAYKIFIEKYVATYDRCSSTQKKKSETVQSS